MKKWWNSPVILQMICVVLMMFLVHSFFLNKAHEELLIEILEDEMPTAIKTLQKNNATLLGIYMNGRVDNEMKIEDAGLDSFYFIDRELEKVLGIEHRPFDWFYFKTQAWSINDMKDKKELSNDDLAYIEDIRLLNQEFIDAYYEILDEKGVGIRIHYDEEKHVIPIYKAFIHKAKNIAMNARYETTYDYEVFMTSEDQVEEGEQALITKESAKALAGDFYLRLTGELPEFEEEEDKDRYTFEKVTTEQFQDGIYNISVSKNGRGIRAYLRYRGGEGAYSEERIDESAKTYIALLVPEHYVLHNKRQRKDEGKLASITYEYIYYNDVYYDQMRTLSLTVDNHGYLENFEQSYGEDISNMPVLVSAQSIEDSITGTGLQELILYRNIDGGLEYRAYMKTNGAIYTIVYDALSGDQKEILAKAEQYYKREALK